MTNWQTKEKVVQTLKETGKWVLLNQRTQYNKTQWKEAQADKLTALISEENQNTKQQHPLNLMWNNQGEMKKRISVLKETVPISN